MAQSASDVPPRLQKLAEHLPAPETIRERLNETRRETAFLRKLLRLALESEAVSKGGER